MKKYSIQFIAVLTVFWFGCENKQQFEWEDPTVFQINQEPDSETGLCSITVNATVKVSGQTGVEMEALTAVSMTVLTIYDMCKAVDRGMYFSEIGLLHKSGGKSGTFDKEKVGK